MHLTSSVRTKAAIHQILGSAECTIQSMNPLPLQVDLALFVGTSPALLLQQKSLSRVRRRTLSPMLWVQKLHHQADCVGFVPLQSTSKICKCS